MPTFDTVLIGEAHANTVAGQRAALLQGYVGYIQRVGPGSVGKLNAGEDETTQAIRPRFTAAAGTLGEGPGAPPFRQSHLLLAAEDRRHDRPRKDPVGIIKLGDRRLGWRSPSNHPPPEDSRNEALGPRRFLDDSARRVAARRSGDAVQVPARGIIATVDNQGH